MKIIWHNKAKEDFILISLYLEQNSSKYSKIFIEKIFDIIEKILKYPKLGKIVYEFNSENIREINFWSYRFVYEISVNEIRILGIIHSRMNLNPKK